MVAVVGLATAASSAQGAARQVAALPAAGVDAGATATGEHSFDLAVRYEHGEGVAQDYARALALYCDAAEQGDSRAFLSLGWMYLNGRGVSRDAGIAVGWLRKASEHGVPQAANLLKLLGGVAPSDQTGCPVSDVASASAMAAPPEIRAMVHHIAPRMGLDAKLVMAVIQTESAFDARAVSRKNAKGLMQLMPETAARFSVDDPFDPEENIRGGTAYLHWLLQRFDGNVTLALAAYNAGEAAVAHYGGVPPYEETIQYIAKIKRLYDVKR